MEVTKCQITPGDIETVADEDELGFTIFCEWNSCCALLVLASELMNHFLNHAKDCIRKLELNTHSRNHETNICGMCHIDLNQLLSASQAESDSSPADAILRHVFFHAYQLLQRGRGSQMQREENLPACALEPNFHEASTKEILEWQNDRNRVPDLPTAFECEWRNCIYHTNNVTAFHYHVQQHPKCHYRPSSSGRDFKPGVIKGKMTLPPVVQCFWSDCQFSTKRLGTLVQHMSTHSMERPLACEKCGRGFYSRNKLQNHLVRQYIPYNVPAEDKCKTSPSAVTATPVSDDKHKKREDWVNDVGLPEFQCLVCWKGFATQALLSNHVRRHVSTLKCWHCDYTSSSHYAIDRHVKFRHTSERPFTCDRCSFTAKCENILQRHIHCVHGSAKSVAAVSVKRSSATLLDDVNTPSAAQTRLDQWKTLAPSNVYQDDSTEDNSGTASATSGKSDKRVYQCHLCDKTFSHGYYLSKHAQKFHQLTRAPGFNRFKFQLCADGHYRIQTTRLESSELSQKMIH